MRLVSPQYLLFKKEMGVANVVPSSAQAMSNKNTSNILAISWIHFKNSKNKGASMFRGK